MVFLSAQGHFRFNRCNNIRQVNVRSNLKKTEKKWCPRFIDFLNRHRTRFNFCEEYIEIFRKLQVLKIYRRNVNTYTEKKREVVTVLLKSHFMTLLCL